MQPFGFLLTDNVWSCESRVTGTIWGHRIDSFYFSKTLTHYTRFRAAFCYRGFSETCNGTFNITRCQTQACFEQKGTGKRCSKSKLRFMYRPSSVAVLLCSKFSECPKSKNPKSMDYTIRYFLHYSGARSVGLFVHRRGPRR